MNPQIIHILALVLVAYVAVFFAAWDTGLTRVLGVRIDALPALMVYAGLNAGWLTSAVVAILGGIWFDSLSSNPLGISVLPLFVTAFALQWHRELILKDDPYAQVVIGGIASALVPLVVVLLLITAGQAPLVGWASFPQWILKSLIGAAMTPILFWLFRRLHRSLNYPLAAEMTFRPDREIKRGR
jgi:rod shape-determining protein MreD